MRRAIVLGFSLHACGCTTRVAYESALGWQRQECRRVPDVSEQQRCLQSSARSYDEYQAERARSRSAPP